ncbi:MAG: iron ABC transporter permease [Halanaerobiales bacterium]|nr:iron ABC transporter permease [Halanaerobiales bacterium]
MNKWRHKGYYWLLVLSLILLALISLTIGKYELPFRDVIRLVRSALFSQLPEDDISAFVLFSIRLPRIIMAILIGSGLAVAGVGMQAVFKNPLVSPRVLGVSAGASFGVSLGILLFNDPILIQLLAFGGGMVAVLLTYLLGQSNRSNTVIMLVLAGIIVSAVFTSLLSLLQYNVDVDTELPSIIYWLMGSLSGIKMDDVKMASFPIILAILLLFLLRWKLNLLTLSDEEAESLGLNVKLERGLVIIAATVISAISVSMCGTIGWVGLITPHLGRMLVGTNHQRLVPVAIIIGGIYLLLIDNIARLLTSAEIPLSILTALIGAPVFALLLKKTGGNWR